MVGHELAEAARLLPRFSATSITSALRSSPCRPL
jgi:hypothetical protein